MLADALNASMPRGFVGELPCLQSVSELKQAGVTLAIIKYGFFVDHWVACLQTDSEVMSRSARREEGCHIGFAKKWRFI